MSVRSRVLLLASVVALGGWLWVGSKSFAPPPAVADEFTVSGPFTHGNLSVFLLHGPDAERARPVLGLDEALARKCAVVHETGSVNELAVENTSESDDLLLLSGDIVKGGRQDRVLQATMILPPKSGKVPVRSFCVEQSRWTKRGAEDDTRFTGNTQTIAGKELKQAVQLAGSQGEVWKNVAQQQAALSKNVGASVSSVESPTSLQLALENDKLTAEVAKFRESISAKVGQPAGVVGFVTVVNGKVTGAEAFGSQVLFRKAWAKAVNAAAVEAVAAKTDKPFSELSAEGVQRFLARAGEDAQRSERLRDQAGVLAGANEAAVFFIDDVGAMIQSPNRASGYTGLNNTIRDRMLQTGGGTNDVITEVNNLVDVPSPTPLNPSDTGQTNLTRSVRVHGRDNFADRAPMPAMANGFPDGFTSRNSTVVEYREKGNGAVIHRSFLPK